MEQKIQKIFECKNYGCVYIFEENKNGVVETIWHAPLFKNGTYDNKSWAPIETKWDIVEHNLIPYGEITKQRFLSELKNI
tara:strand:+ start:247 stop:486 length:240 start_codon:yes stop_codon:yes gene_type:complete